MTAAAKKSSRPKIGDVRNGQRLIARINTWCRDCKAFRMLAMWRVERRALRVGKTLVAHDVPHFHMLHCEICGHERRLERGNNAVTVVAPPSAKEG